LKNDGNLTPLLPEGTPFGLLGSSSLYKRETYPSGAVYKNDVTAWVQEGVKDPYQNLGTLTFSGFGGNWFEAGRRNQQVRQQ